LNFKGTFHCCWLNESAMVSNLQGIISKNRRGYFSPSGTNCSYSELLFAKTISKENFTVSKKPFQFVRCFPLTAYVTFPSYTNYLRLLILWICPSSLLRIVHEVSGQVMPTFYNLFMHTGQTSKWDDGEDKSRRWYYYSWPRLFKTIHGDITKYTTCI
jgi:hypothetical protein